MARCPICGAEALEPLFRAESVPVFCNVQWAEQAAAIEAPCGELDLLLCRECGHAHNAAFHPEKVAYSPAYDNSQHHSTTFRAYATHLVDHLIGTYAVREKPVVDIGCGRGDLLALLAERGSNHGFGFDPGYAPTTVPPSPRVTLSQQRFDADRAREIGAALVCCRHVLEHVEDPGVFLSTLHEAMSAHGRPILYIEVPNGEQLMRDAAIWDYIYEHYSYFSRRSLCRILHAAGFEILALREDFGGQFLCAEVRVAGHSGAGPGKEPRLPVAAAGARGTFTAKLERWKRWSTDLRDASRTSAVWGAGSKGVMFLNLLDLVASAQVPYAIDQNPGKHGRYLAGSGQVVRGPAQLTEAPVDEVVVMNAIYREEIQRQLDQMHANALVHTA